MKLLRVMLMLWMLGTGWLAVPQSIHAQSRATATPTPMPVSGFRAPVGGEALQGVALISGSLPPDGWTRAEVAFAYAQDDTNTWFLIASLSAMPEDGVLARWDTSVIGDGTYQLRLRVVQEVGTAQDFQVEGVRVRNYSPIETLTPTPTGTIKATIAPLPTATVTRTPLPDFVPSPPSAEPLPPNPAQATPADLVASALQGVIGLTGFLLVGLFYVALKRIFHIRL